MPKPLPIEFSTYHKLERCAFFFNETYKGVFDNKRMISDAPIQNPDNVMTLILCEGLLIRTTTMNVGGSPDKLCTVMMLQRCRLFALSIRFLVSIIMRFTTEDWRNRAHIHNNKNAI